MGSKKKRGFQRRTDEERLIQRKIQVYEEVSGFQRRTEGFQERGRRVSERTEGFRGFFSRGIRKGLRFPRSLGGFKGQMVFKKERGFLKGLVVSKEGRCFTEGLRHFKNEEGVPERTGGFRGGEGFHRRTDGFKKVRGFHSVKERHWFFKETKQRQWVSE